MKRWERKIYDGDRKGRWNYKSGMRGWQENDDKTWLMMLNWIITDENRTLGDEVHRLEERYHWAVEQAQ